MPTTLQVRTLPNFSVAEAPEEAHKLHIASFRTSLNRPAFGSKLDLSSADGNKL